MSCSSMASFPNLTSTSISSSSFPPSSPAFLDVDVEVGKVFPPCSSSSRLPFFFGPRISGVLEVDEDGTWVRSSDALAGVEGVPWNFRPVFGGPVLGPSSIASSSLSTSSFSRRFWAASISFLPCDNSSAVAFRLRCIIRELLGCFWAHNLMNRIFLPSTTFQSSIFTLKKTATTAKLPIARALLFLSWAWASKG